MARDMARGRSAKGPELLCFDAESCQSALGGIANWTDFAMASIPFAAELAADSRAFAFGAIRFAGKPIAR